MLVTIKDLTGKQVGEVHLDESIFSAPVNKPLMHQALIRQLSNARLGTHKTKGRSEVRGGGRKPWRQKGTGRARQGSTRAPNWVGGGTVFGPQPRKYTKSMPRKMRRSALRSALTVKAAAGQIVVVDKLAMDVPKTKQMISALDALDVSAQTVLLVMAEQDLAVARSARNLPQVKTLNAAYLNIRDLLGYDTMVVSSDAVEYIEAWLSVDGYESDADVAQEADAEMETDGGMMAGAGMNDVESASDEPVDEASVTDVPDDDADDSTESTAEQVDESGADESSSDESSGEEAPSKSDEE